MLVPPAPPSALPAGDPTSAGALTLDAPQCLHVTGGMCSGFSGSESALLGLMKSDMIEGQVNVSGIVIFATRLSDSQTLIICEEVLRTSH